jgi:hypothetical protein
MIDHGLSIRDDKVYLTIPKKAGSSFREVVVNAKRYLPINCDFDTEITREFLFEKISELADAGHDLNLAIHEESINLYVYSKDGIGGDH